MTRDRRILIVEDNAIISMDLEDQLIEEGFDPVCAATLSQAQDLLVAQTPLVALLDMHLKAETTFDFAVTLKDKGVPFLFLSGNDSSSLPDPLKDEVILTKPVRIKDVLEVIAGFETRG